MHAGTLTSRPSVTAIQPRIRGKEFQTQSTFLSTAAPIGRFQHKLQSVSNWTCHRSRVPTRTLVCKASGGLLGGLKKAFKGSNKPRIDEDLVEFPPYQYDTPNCQVCQHHACCKGMPHHCTCTLLPSIASKLSLHAVTNL